MVLEATHMFLNETFEIGARNTTHLYQLCMKHVRGVFLNFLFRAMGFKFTLSVMEQD